MQGYVTIDIRNNTIWGVGKTEEESKKDAEKEITLRNLKFSGNKIDQNNIKTFKCNNFEKMEEYLEDGGFEAPIVIYNDTVYLENVWEENNEKFQGVVVKDGEKFYAVFNKEVF